jgi:hypothetical protein
VRILKIDGREMTDLKFDTPIAQDELLKSKLENDGFDMKRTIMSWVDPITDEYIYSQKDDNDLNRATNKEIFFGDKVLVDTIYLLTCENHPRPECRLFKKVLSEMTSSQLSEWLNSPKDTRFNW